MNNLPIDPRRLTCATALMLFACFSGANAVEIDSRVALAQGASDVLMIMADQSTPPVPSTSDYRERRRELVDALKSRANRQQRNVRAWLDTRGIAHRDFWIANVIQATLPAATTAAIAQESFAMRVARNPLVATSLPQAERMSSLAPKLLQDDPALGIAWGVTKIETERVWAAGVFGAGVVIGGEDTGYQWDHPALIGHYRGWNGTTANHDHNWHDAIHDASAGNPCRSDSPTPCDDQLHGTHTAGTFVGDDNAPDGQRHQTGVAPGAKWIGCRNMDEGAGTPARYIECMQFMMAPTKIDGSDAEPDLAADVISNSWSCPASEGCPADALEAVVNNVVAAGIFFVAAAQNYGANCSTIEDAPATYDSAFDVGATDSDDDVAGFSSRGPLIGNAKIRPDLVAPGVFNCSSIPVNKYSCTMQGTSMATPHVAGAAALLMSAFPDLKGNPQKVASILRGNTTTAGIDDPYQDACGGIPTTTWPNYSEGYGRLDVWNAYHDIIAIHGFDG